MLRDVPDTGLGSRKRITVQKVVALDTKTKVVVNFQEGFVPSEVVVYKDSEDSMHDRVLVDFKCISP